MVWARLSKNSLVDSSPVMGLFFAGSMGSGAVALWLRSCIILMIKSSLPLAASRFSGLVGAFMIFSVIRPTMKPSDSAMCSEHSATDQRSGPGLKFHCAAERPRVASRKAFFEPSSSATALSRSSLLSVCVASAVKIRASAKKIAFMSSLRVGIWCRYCSALFHADVGDIFGEGGLLVFLESPLSLEVVVVEEGVDGVVHVAVVGGL